MLNACQKKKTPKTRADTMRLQARHCVVWAALCSLVTARQVGEHGTVGVLDSDGIFIPGTSGADWPHPEAEDLSRCEDVPRVHTEHTMR